MSDRWVMEQERIEIEQLPKSESLFSIGNGYLGFRGFLEERSVGYHPGVFINGMYELEDICYGESAYGFAKQNQYMMDLPDARYVQILVDGDVVRVDQGTVHSHYRSLDMRSGVIDRELDWESEDGSRVLIRFQTLVSYQFTHAVALKVDVTPIRCNTIEIHSSIGMPKNREVDPEDPRVAAGGGLKDLTDLACSHEEDPYHSILLRCRSHESAKELLCASVHTQIVSSRVYRDEHGSNPIPYRLVVSGSDQLPVSLTLLGLYFTEPAGNGHILRRQFDQYRDTVCGYTFEQLVSFQKEHLKALYQRSSITLPGRPEVEKILRFNMFQLYQSCGTDGLTSLAAKGLTGAGYEGHYFWDTEIYGLPCFIFTDPKRARSLLEYRIGKLSQARERARVMNQKGVLFPWRTIDGQEASAYFPAGTAQYHINADIAYALILYLEATGDLSLLLEGGATLLFETARFWYDLGFFNPREGGAFCIHEVTGPDEYTALVDNNLYTNLMAAYNLRMAASWFERLQDEQPEYIRTLASQLSIEEQELQLWKRAAELIHLPFDPITGVNAQDDRFFDRQRWDFSASEGRHPLLLHYHPLVIYRYQVLKQADVVMAHVLLPDAYPWYQKRRDFLYYEELTTGDSSLSACIQGILAVELGFEQLAEEYLRTTTYIDVDDVKKNAKDGLHTAAMAGSWLFFAYGLCGMRLTEGRLSFRPVTLPGYREYSLRLTLLGRRLELQVTREVCTYTLLEGEPLEVLHNCQKIELKKSITVTNIYPFRAALFDLDGVITATDEYHYQAWKALSNEQGWHFSRTINEQLRGVSRTRSLQIICEHNGISLSEEELKELTDRKNSTYISLLQNLTPEDLLPGTVDLLVSLRKEGIKTAIASASRNAAFILSRLGIEEYIDVLVPASEVLVGKPDPEVFVRAADMLDIPRQSCVGFEDAPAGIEAIHAAGMKCVGVSESTAQLECDLHIADLSEVDYGRLRSLFDGE